MIPNSEIQKGIDLCLKQTELLVSSSQLLYDSKKYPISLALSILAIEEAAKTKLLLDCREKKKDVPWEQWRAFSRGKEAHRLKLSYDYESAKERFATDITPEKYYGQLAPLLLELGPNKNAIPAYEVMQSKSQEDIDHLTALDIVKQDCLYTHWSGLGWQNFISRVDKKQQEPVALVELYRATYQYWSCYRWNKFPVIYSPGTSEYEVFSKDISNQKIAELGRILITAKYKKKADSWRWTMKQYIGMMKKK